MPSESRQRLRPLARRRRGQKGRLGDNECIGRSVQGVAGHLTQRGWAVNEDQVVLARKITQSNAKTLGGKWTFNRVSMFKGSIGGENLNAITPRRVHNGIRCNPRAGSARTSFMVNSGLVTPRPMVAFPWGSRSITRTRSPRCQPALARPSVTVVLPTRPSWRARPGFACP